jgi:hypothetical protein
MNRRQAHRVAAIRARVGDALATGTLTMTLTAAAVLALPTGARAIRPFVTDDARVVGDRLAQIETWLLLDPHALEHYALGALGPTEWLELTVGAVHGGVFRGEERGYSLSGPILQLKALLTPAIDGGHPGVALTAGVLPPWGFGGFLPAGWGAFAYVAVTQSLWEEALLLHANLGIAVGDDRNASRLEVLPTAGFGFQAKVVGGFHAVAEIYYGDPYDPAFAVPATQVGFRHIFSDSVQIDGTFGMTLAPQTQPDGAREHGYWGTLGLRMVSPELW